jgi:murein DD-endopeptidase MepM/ murein hydrolase activator NlpD
MVRRPFDLATRRPWWPWRVVALAMVALLLAGPATAQIDEDDVEAARQRMVTTQERLDEMGAEWEEAVARSALLEAQVEQMTAAVRTNEEQLEELSKDVDQYALELYMGSAGSSASLLPFTASPGEFEAGLEYLEDVGASDDQLIRDLEAAQARQIELTAELEATKQEQAEAQAELETIVAALQDELVAAQDDYEQIQADLQAQIEEERRRLAEEQARREEEERRQAAPAQSDNNGSDSGGSGDGPQATEPPTSEPPPSPPTIGNGSGYCPVQGPHTFGDGWGAARGGGRYHSGIDIVAATGTPLVAVYDGYVERADYSSLGGNQVYYRDNAGNVYYYAHLNGYAAGIGSGVQLSAGDLLGYVGSTGNSSGPHLHFSYGPGGGGYVDPYGLVSSLCR